MKSYKNEKKVTVQSLITSVPATSGGEQTGPQSSSSSACKITISEVGNLASVIEKVSRSTENKKTNAKGLEYDKKNGESQICNSIKIEPSSPILTKATIKNDSIKFEDNKECTKENLSQLQTKVKEEPVTNNLSQPQINTPMLTPANVLKDLVKMESNNTNNPIYCKYHKKNKRRRSRSQRKKAAKLKKLAIEEEERKQNGQKKSVSPTVTSSEKKDTIPIIEKEPCTSKLRVNVDIGVINDDSSKKRMAFLIANGYSREFSKVFAQKPLATFERLRQRIIEKKARESRNDNNQVYTTSCQSGNLIETSKTKERKYPLTQKDQQVKVAKVQEQNTTENKNIPAEGNKRSPSLTQTATIENSTISHQKVVVGFFPNSLDDVTDRILSFIQWQNEGLYVFSWKLLSRTIENSNVMLTLLIDKISAAKLEEIKGEIFYKFRQIRLDMKDYDEMKETATNSTNINPIESISQPKRPRL